MKPQWDDAAFRAKSRATLSETMDMGLPRRRNLPWGIVLVLAALAAAVGYPEAPAPAPVVRAGSRTLFSLSGSIGGTSAVDRARIATARIAAILANARLAPRSIAVRAMSDGTPVVALGGVEIVQVTPADARTNRMPAPQLAGRWAAILRTNLTQLQPVALQQQSTDVSTLNEHRVRLLILQVALILIAARLFGELALRLGQPPVIGQLLAGIVLGHSILGNLWPELRALVFPVEATQSYLLEVVSWIGVLFLLLLTGLETDMALIRQQGRPAVLVAVTGVALPFALGAGLGYIVPAPLLTTPQSRPILALFLGTVLSVSSVPVIAKILLDMRLLRRNIGQLILAAALAHDTIGWLILGVVASLAGGGGIRLGEAARTLAGAAAFLLFAGTLGRPLTRRLLRWVNDRLRIEQALLTAIVVLMLVAAAATEAIGVHAVLGAFVMGILLRESPVVNERVLLPLEAVTNAIFAPIFFADAGLHVNLALLADPRLLLLAALLIAAASFGKVLGCYAGARWAGTSRWEALSLGIGVNARGAMGLIVGVLGYSLGILTVDMYSMIILMAIVTTVAAPPLLRWTLARVQPASEEQERLRREALRTGSFMGGLHRVLLPSRGGRDSGLAAALVGAIGRHQPLDVTAMYVQNAATAGPEPAPADELRKSLDRSGVTYRLITVDKHPPDRAIVEEAQRGYDLLALGCGPMTTRFGAVFGPVVDSVARQVRAPLLIVRAPRSDDRPVKKILLPTATAAHSVHAAELAIAIARAAEARIVAMHVYERLDESLFWLGDHERTAEVAGADLLDQVHSLGEAYGVEVETLLLRSDHAAREIVRVTGQRRVDLVVLGGGVRPARSLFLGSSVSAVLRGVDCAVAVLRP